MCEEQEAADVRAARADWEAAAYESHANSRQSWLFWGSIFSALWGVGGIIGGIATLNDPYYAYYHGTSGQSAGLGYVIGGTILIVAAIWAFMDAGGFKRGVYDQKSTGHKVLYWLAAMFGLVFGVGLILAILLGIAIVIGGGAAVVGSDVQSAKARGIISDGVTDAIRRDRGHR